MRELKFRAYDGEKMLLAFDLSQNPKYWWEGNKDYQLFQYTGLTDSEGTEIYEGDIIDFTYWWFDGNEAESHLIGEVIYMPDLLSFALRGIKNKDWIRHVGGEDGDIDTTAFAFFQFEEADFYVLGNVHENPDLMEESK